MKKYKKANISFQLSTRLQEIKLLNISSNLILSDVFNPTAQIFSINTQSPYTYLNVTFSEFQLNLNDCFIESVIFEIVSDTDSDTPLPNLDFKIGIEFIEQ